ncbi:ATP-binding protein [Paraburkholderia ferrariae]|uniref:ATP-binding protein n=1 Tax=Paraburkholderia ferrariae TaxID=386056 RepID=UPI0005A84D8E|nr:AAA family ATPase [Paraburkholderia ferrariae]
MHDSNGTSGEDVRIDLPPKAFDVLRHLAEHAGAPVTSDALLDAVWPDTHVQPEVLRSHIASIRRALGDNARQPRLVETLRGHGYRLVAGARAVAPDDTPRAAAQGPEAFVGRVRELNVLQAALQRARSGVRQLVVVAGEAGIGKTALIDGFLARIGGDEVRACRGGCVEGHRRGEVFYPVLEALGRLCRGARGEEVVRSIVTIAPTWAALMPAHVPEAQRRVLRAEVMGAGKDRILREGCALLEALAAGRPLLLVLDDLQWSDFASVELLETLAQRDAPARLMIVCNCRIERTGVERPPMLQLSAVLASQRRCGWLPLAQLALDEVVAWLTDGAPSTPADEEFAHLLAERSGGNPLFIRAILDHLLDASLACRNGRGWRATAPAAAIRAALPPTIAQAIDARIRRLDEPTQRLLEAASVAGQVFSSATVADAAQLSCAAFDALCDALVRTGHFIRHAEALVLPDGSTCRRFSFLHALIGQVFYERQGLARRSATHRLIGERLEQLFLPGQRDDVAAELCRHFTDAGLWSKALDCVRLVLRPAKARSAYRDALAILDQGDALLARLPTDAQWRWRVEFGEARATLLAAAHDPLALDVYVALVDDAARAGMLDAQLRALMGLSYVSGWSDQTRSIACLDEALRLVASHPDRRVGALTQVICRVRRVWALGWRAADDEACRAALATLHETGDTIASARGQLEYSMLEIVSTRYGDALKNMQTAHRTLHDHALEHPQFDIARGMWMIRLGSAWAYLALGELGRALDEFDSGIRFFHDNGNYFAARTLQVYRGWLLVHSMDYEIVVELDQQLRRTALGADVGDRDTLPGPQRRAWTIVAGLAHAGLGDDATASARFSEAEAEMDREPVMFDWYWRLALDWGQAGLALADPACRSAAMPARRFLDRALATDERFWHALAWERMTEAALRDGRLNDAASCLNEAFAAIDGFATPLADWRLHRTAAGVHRARGDGSAGALAQWRADECRCRLAASIASEQGIGRRLAKFDDG